MIETSPAARLLRILWAARLPFLASVGLFVAGAGILTSLQPRLYSSQALLSVKAPPEVIAERLRTQSPKIAPDGQRYDENDPLRQSGPGRYAPRLVAPGFVTEAAHDAGLLADGVALDEREAAAWVTAETIETSDLIRLRTWQPTPDEAQRLAQAIVTRGLDANRRDEAEVVAPAVQRRLTLVDPPTHPSAPAYPVTAVNLSVGFALGVLAASAYVAAREMLRQS